MQILLQQLVNGLTIGAGYALVAVGFTLIFGVLRVVYLAHSAVLVVGAYLGLFALEWSGSIPLALVLGTVGAALLGLVVERVALRPVAGQNHLITLVTTISIATVIQESLRLSIHQGQPISYPSGMAATLLRFHLGGIELHLTVGQLAVMLVTLVLVVALTVLVQRTWMGRSIRAVADNPTIAAMLGVRVKSVSAQTVAIASALAGAAGVLLGLTLPAIDPYVGEHLQFKALAVVLFGGLGSVPGAVLGGLLLGLVEAMAAGYLETSYRDLFAFAAMVLILTFRPAGLLGRRPVERV
ncbi:MAG: branched-chain amino acid ABC transporter permease [Rhizobiales bacterium]|nr:branched-chain amino acid ABC transporter permease [Hyphomicrobiales bacterium]